MNPADRTCLERLQSGDAEALAELYDRYGALLHPLALRIVNDPAEADEVLYDVWLRIARRTVVFEPSRGVAVWMVSLVRERALERRRAGSGRSGGGPAPASAGPIEVVPERMELADRAVEALALFDEQERQVVELAFYDGLTQNEISSRLGASLRDVRAWTRRAFDRLHEAVPREEAA
jgi:RNA polymerase sigma-70 factor (ECF subfamily)